MNDLAGHVRDYLRLRRALGFKLAREGVVLPQFVDYLQAADASTITADLAIAWAQLPQGVEPINWVHRLGAVRGFALYLKTIDPATEIPPCGVFPRPPKRPAPYLYSDADIDQLLEAAGELRPALRAATMQTLLGLLAVSGLRIGEAVKLQRDEVDLRSGVLTVTGPKSGHPRLVPLHPSTAGALRAYAKRRDRLCPARRADAFFVSSIGSPLRYSSVRRAFIPITMAIGLRTATVKPRIHDLRHSFAVRCLLNWYRSGVDVAGRMGVLSTYLGHVNPAGTYWYLSASPELMEQAAHRLDSVRGGRP
jgi:integrase